MNRKIASILFISVFIIGLLPSVAVATTVYPTGTSSPTGSAFEEYDFTETYPLDDIANPKIPDSYTIESSPFPPYTSLATHVAGYYRYLGASDNNREQWSAVRVKDPFDVVYYEVISFYYSIYLPSALTYTLTFEGYKTTVGNAITIEMYVRSSTGGWEEVLSAVPTSETTYTYTLSYRYGNYVQVKFSGSGVDDGTNYDQLYIDRLYIQPHYDGSSAATNFADDMRKSHLWQTGGYCAVTTYVTSDGDYLYAYPIGFRFDYEGWGLDTHEDGDDNFVGWTEVENGYDDTNIDTAQYYSSVSSVEIDVVHAAYTGIRKSDFTLTSGDFTIEFYVRGNCIGSTVGDYLYFVFKSGSTRFFNFAITEASSTAIRFRWYSQSAGAYQTLVDKNEGAWYKVQLNFDDDTDTVDIYIDGTWYNDKPYRFSSDGLTELEIAGRTFGGSGMNIWLDNLLCYMTDTITAIPTSGYNCDYARIEAVDFSQTISSSVPFLQVYAETSNSSSNTMNLHLGSSTLFLVDGLNVVNAYEMTGSTTISAFRIWYLGNDTYFKVDYVRFYGYADYTYNDVGGDSRCASYKTGAYLINKLGMGSTGDEYYYLERDIPNFSTDTFKYCVVDGYVSGYAQLKIVLVFTDSSTQTLTITSTVRSEHVFNLTSGKTVDKIRIMTDDYPDSTSSGLAFTYVYLISFSVMDISITALNLNYENTWLSTDQNITISGITVAWGDGNTISPWNIRFSIYENSSILVFNESAAILPYRISVRLHNATYMVGIEFCNDSRYRYFVLGGNYTFWIVGTDIISSFYYDIDVTSDNNYILSFYQTSQFRYSINGSVVTSQPLVHVYMNGTDKGYKTLGTDGWLPYEMIRVSLSVAEADDLWYFEISFTSGGYYYLAYSLLIIPQNYITVERIVTFSFYSTVDGLGIPMDLFKVYVDGVRLTSQTIILTSTVINLTITDYFDSIIYQNTNYVVSTHNSIGLDYYEIGFSNTGDDPIRLNITRSGRTRTFILDPGIFVFYRFINGYYNITVEYLVYDNEGAISSATSWKNLTNYVIGYPGQVISFSHSKILPMKINIFDQNGKTLPFDDFVVYVNGTRIYDQTYWCSSYETYSIEVLDVFGNTLNTTVTRWSRTVNIFIYVYLFKVFNQDDEIYYFQITQAGTTSTWVQYIAPGEAVVFYLYAGTYNWGYVNTVTSAVVSGTIVVDSNAGYIITGTTLDAIYVELLSLSGNNARAYNDISERLNSSNRIDTFLSSVMLVILIPTLVGVLSAVSKKEPSNSPSTPKNPIYYAESYEEALRRLSEAKRRMRR